MDMEEIEPPESDSRGKHGTRHFLDLGLEAAHPSKPTKDRLADRPAEAEGSIAFGIRKMIEASPILVTPWIVSKQVAYGDDAEFGEGGELWAPDPSQMLQRSLRIMGRKGGGFGGLGASFDGRF